MGAGRGSDFGGSPIVGLGLSNHGINNALSIKASGRVGKLIEKEISENSLSAGEPDASSNALLSN